MLSISINKKAQVWYADFTIGLLLFLVVTVIYFQYTTNLSNQQETSLREMVLELKSVSSSLISPGYPDGWSESDVERIGLTDGNYRLNQTKLEQFYDIDHIDMLNKFNTRFNFYMELRDRSGNVIPIDGKDGAGLEATDASSKVMMNRFVIYNSSMVKMVMYLWQ